MYTFGVLMDCQALIYRLHAAEHVRDISQKYFLCLNSNAENLTK